MIPVNGLEELQVDSSLTPSKTYKIDFDSGRIIGIIDELEALKQHIHKTLLTERLKYVIYDAQVGVEFESLLINNFSEELLVTELKRVIVESLKYDERILSIEDFSFQIEEDSITTNFSVESIYGKFTIQEEVQ